MPLPSAEDLKAWLLDELSDAHKVAAGIIIAPAHSTGPYSQIFRAQVPGIEAPGAIKVCIDVATQSPSQEYARRQYLALSRLHAASEKNGGYRSLKPYPLLSERGCVVTEWIVGELLEVRLSRWGAKGSQMARDAAAAGRWIRCFHDDGRIGTGALETEVMISQVMARARQARPRYRDGPLFRQVMELLEKTAPAVGAIELPISWVHGDFKASNVLFADGEPIAIDVTLPRNSTITHDLAQFLFELDLLSLEPKGLRLLASRDAVMAGFLSGYFGDLDQAPRLPLDWTLLHLMLYVWSARETLDRRSARQWFICQRIQYMLPRLMQNLSAAAGSRA